jgi:hypothetical protein
LVVLKLRGIRNLNMIVNEYEFIDNKELIKKMYYDATTEKFSYFLWITSTSRINIARICLESMNFQM